MIGCYENFDRDTLWFGLWLLSVLAHFEILGGISGFGGFWFEGGACLVLLGGGVRVG